MSLVATANDLIARKAVEAEAIFIYDGQNPLSAAVNELVKRGQDSDAINPSAPVEADVFEMETRTSGGGSIVGYVEKMGVSSEQKKSVSVVGGSSMLLSIAPWLLELPHTPARPRVNVFVSAVESDLDDHNLTQVPRFDKVLRAIRALDVADDFAIVFASTPTEVAQHTSHLLKKLNDQGRDVLYIYDGHNLGTTQASIDVHTLTSESLAPPFRYTGPESPKDIFVIPASIYSLVAEFVFNHGPPSKDVNAGIVVVNVLRDWDSEAFSKTLPKSVKALHLFTLGLGTAASSIFYADIITIPNFQSYKILPLSVPYTHTSTRVDYWIGRLGYQETAESFVTYARNELDKKSNTHFLTIWDADSGITSSLAGLLRGGPQFPHTAAWTAYDQISQGGIQFSGFAASKENSLPPIDFLSRIESPDLVIIGSPATITKAYNPLSHVSSKTTVVYIGKWPSAEDAAEKLVLHPNAKASYAVDVTTAAKHYNVKPVEILESIADSLMGLSGIKKVNENVLTSEFSHSLKGKSTSTSIEQLEILPAYIQATGQWPASKVLTPEVNEASEANAIKQRLLFPDAFDIDAHPAELRPDLPEKTFLVEVTEKRRLTPLTYDRNVFHIEFNTAGTGLKYAVGEALGVHGWNDADDTLAFIRDAGFDPDAVVSLPYLKGETEDNGTVVHRTVFQVLQQQLDLFGKPPREFFGALAKFATDIDDERTLRFIASQLGSSTFKKLSEVDTVSYADVLRSYKSLKYTISDLVRLIEPIKPRHYSIASSQNFVGDKVHLLVVAVDWKTPDGKIHYGQCTRYLDSLKVGDKVTVSVRPSVMKLPPLDSQGVIMAGLGTGAAPFRAFIQERAWRQAQGYDIGPMLYYFGSRHRDMEYLYGEEIEAYLTAGVISKTGLAFSRDGPKKVYIQNKMTEDSSLLSKYLLDDAAFYLCGPTWPVPDVYNALIESFTNAGLSPEEAAEKIEHLKENERYVLEVY